MTETDLKRNLEETVTAVAPEDQQIDKKARTTSPNVEALKKQVEYYLSDANLKHDKFFHSKISENAEGWLTIDHILACNKVKALTREASEIVAAIATSADLEAHESGNSIRRKTPLPAFEGELKRSPKNKDKNPVVYKRQITLGEFKFPNLNSAKKRVGEILKSRRAGVLFKEGTPDYNLVLAVMSEHPNASVKMQGMTGIKVDVSPVGESRCFYIAKGENKDQFEDISIVKAFGNLESKLLSAAEKTETAVEEDKTVTESAEKAPVSEEPVSA